jgi:hypothetical protein
LRIGVCKQAAIRLGYDFGQSFKFLLTCCRIPPISLRLQISIEYDYPNRGELGQVDRWRAVRPIHYLIRLLAAGGSPAVGGRQ